MTETLVQRLRRIAAGLGTHGVLGARPPMLDAADEIERLTAERDELLDDLGGVILACPPDMRRSPASDGVKELRADRDRLAALANMEGKNDG